MRPAGHLALALASAGCLASPPSGLPEPGEDGGEPAERLLSIEWTPGGQISDSLFAHADGKQGTILLWIELGSDLTGLESQVDVAHMAGFTIALDPIAGSVLARLDDPGEEIRAEVDDWNPGTSHLITLRWDAVSVLGDLQHVSLRVDGGEAVYGVQEPFAVTYGFESPQIIAAGASAEDGPVVLRSAFVLRRPIRDDGPPSGVYLGIDDEHEAIFAAGVDGDPTLVFGSWDVVLGLSPHGDPVTGEPFLGWSHPFADNLLGGGGFMLARSLSQDGWTLVDLSGSLGGAAGTWVPTTGTLNGGYRLGNSELHKTIPDVAIGEQVLLRVIGYPSVGTGAVPQVCLGPIGNACTTPLSGRATSSRILPDVLVLEYVADAGGVEVVLSMTDSDGETTRPIVVYSQAELHRNLLVDPGFESEGGSLVPPGWSASDELVSGEVAQSPGDARTGSYGLAIASVSPASEVPDAVLQEPSGMTDLELYLVGGFFRRTGGDPAGITSSGSLYRQDADFGEDQSLVVPDPGAPGAWHHRFAVGKRLSGNGRSDGIRWGGTEPSRLTATAIDDAYVVRLAPVDLTFTYAPP